MVSLTLQQRNIIHLLLNSDTPVAVSQLAEQTNLSARQVNYRLKPVRTWLAAHNVQLKSTPGVGIALTCTPNQRKNLLRELNAESDFQVVLTAGQRQQLAGLALLSQTEPLILNWLQLSTAVSRNTVFKDLDLLEEWTGGFGLNFVRKPNYGIEVAGPELARRQALIALAWGDPTFEAPLLGMAYGDGLTFALRGNSSLPIIQHISALIKQWNTATAFEWVAVAEAQLGGRFTDNAVLHLALALAIQAQRVQAGQHVKLPAETVEWLQGQKVWHVAVNLANIVWPSQQPALIPEIAAISMQLLSGPRDHMWPGDLDIDPDLTDLIEVLMSQVARAFATPRLQHDTPLRDGLVAHIIPAFLRQRFGLWAPAALPDEKLPDRYQREYDIARELARLVTERTGVILPDGELTTLAMLLRAAFIRERTSRPKRVVIICPSGMATAQLLVARLKARFPSLEIQSVLSLRELTAERVADAQLLISTVPVQSPRPSLQVIRVHPLLLPEDIETITQWMS
ncbi:MAG: transcription antiterminator [Anaerolineae bacterium]